MERVLNYINDTKFYLDEDNLDFYKKIKDEVFILEIPERDNEGKNCSTYSIENGIDELNNTIRYLYDSDVFSLNNYTIDFADEQIDVIYENVTNTKKELEEKTLYIKILTPIATAVICALTDHFQTELSNEHLKNLFYGNEFEENIYK